MSDKKKMTSRIGYTWENWEEEYLLDCFLVRDKKLIAKGEKPLRVRVTVEEIKE